MSDQSKLSQHARQRSEDAFARARNAIRELDKSGQSVTFVAVAARARVSREFLYSNQILKTEIQALRRPGTRTGPVPAADRASLDSIKARLSSTLEENRRLREENAALRQELELVYGELREDTAPPLLLAVRPAEPSPLKEAKVDALWDALVESLGSAPTTASGRGAWNKAIRELREAGATAPNIKAAASAYRHQWPDIAITPTALAKHWHVLAPVEAPDVNPLARALAWARQTGHLIAADDRLDVIPCRDQLDSDEIFQVLAACEQPVPDTPPVLVSET